MTDIKQTIVDEARALGHRPGEWESGGGHQGRDVVECERCGASAEVNDGECCVDDMQDRCDPMGDALGAIAFMRRQGYG